MTEPMRVSHFTILVVGLTVGVFSGCVAPRTDWQERPLPSPRRYSCVRACTRLTIDGLLGEGAWRRARALDAFVDIEGVFKPSPRYGTEVRMLWDDTFLYVGARLEEPHVWATRTEHDAIVWHENDFEVFIDPDDDGRNYYEIEVNALNTIFDLLLERPYHQGGSARHEWTAEGLRSAVHVEGTVNDPTDVDRGWVVEIAIPWSALAEFSTVPVPPRPGDRWRMNFSRVQWDLEVVEGVYRKIDGRREHNWVWSPQGKINMHIPDRWGYVTFED